MIMETKNITPQEVTVRLKKSKAEGETNMKQSGLSKAKDWCFATAEYHEIKRLAACREDLGVIYREIVEECGFSVIAEAAVAGDENHGYDEAVLFWESVGATRYEASSFEFLDGFLKGCELFWKATAKNI